MDFLLPFAVLHFLQVPNLFSLQSVLRSNSLLMRLLLLLLHLLVSSVSTEVIAHPTLTVLPVTSATSRTSTIPSAFRILFLTRLPTVLSLMVLAHPSRLVVTQELTAVPTTNVYNLLAMECAHIQVVILPLSPSL